MSHPTSEARVNRHLAMVGIVLDLQNGRWVSTRDCAARLGIAPGNAGRIIREARILITPALHGFPNGVGVFGLTDTESRILGRMCAASGRPVPADDFARALGFAYPAGMAPLVRAHVTNLRCKGVPVRTEQGRSSYPTGWGIDWPELCAAVQALAVAA